MNIDNLKAKIQTALPYCLVYGEGRQIRQDNIPGVVFVTDKNQPCAVSNSHEAVIFWVKNGSEKAPDAGFGNRIAKRKVINYTLVANSKSNISELLLQLINGLENFDWSSESFVAQNIASDFFGLTQGNLATYFYTLDFSVIETIDCKNC